MTDGGNSLLQKLRSSFRAAFSAHVDRGFTLIEIAIVLVVIGLIVSGGLLAVSPVIQSAKISETKQKMATVEAALLGYVIQNGCMPCPARPDASTGQAAPAANATGEYTSGCNSGTNCLGSTTAAGVVPWVTLGISENDATDAWGRRLGYGVAVSRTASSSMQRNSDGSFPSFTSTITMESSTATGSLGYNAIVYVLVSFGRDGSFGRTNSGTQLASVYGQTTGPGQYENGDDDLTFATGNINTTNSTSYFDDIVSFKSFQPLIISCGAGSCGNPS
jgi:prepilin-type N-terminal cleavage/methylation domain-containing protein